MKSITLGKSGNKCRHCQADLYWKAHKEITSKELKRSFYFSKWEYCGGCKTTWLHPEFKIENRNTAARQMQERREYGEQMSLLRSLYPS